MTAPASAPTTAPARPGFGFWLAVGLGAAVIGYGLAGLLHDHEATKPAGLALWFGAAGLAHDAAVAPLLVGVGWLTRRLPAFARVPVRLGLAASALLVAIVWPLAQGWGRSASLPSALPLDYGRNLVAALAAIWVAVAVAIGLRLRRTRPEAPR